MAWVTCPYCWVRFEVVAVTAGVPPHPCQTTNGRPFVWQEVAGE